MVEEEKIFKNTEINFDKLIDYGFKKIDNCYFNSINILNNSFKVDIKIDSKEKVTSKIIDLSFNEEYNNYKIESINGEFVNKIRKEYEDILLDIRNKCCTKQTFIFDQTNKIANFIKETFGDTPEFMWEKYPGFGVFRNPKTKKWYALIMNISKNKIDKGCEEIEIINLKLHKDKIPTLLTKKGFYKAYHMNKNNWISIILDDTLSDKEIIECIIESYNLSEKQI